VTCCLGAVAPDPPFSAADDSSPIISQGTPIRSICALMSSGSAHDSAVVKWRF
jgi:hypothetical protein